MLDPARLAKLLFGAVLAALVAAALPALAAAQEEQGPPYSIAIGTFAKKENADAFAAKLAGYGAHVVPVAAGGKSFWRVDLSSQQSKEEAQAVLNSARILGYRDAKIVSESESLPAPAQKSAPTSAPSATRGLATSATSGVPLYAVAIGVFTVKANADALVAKLVEHDALVVPLVRNGKSLWRVELGSPGNKEKARATLASARSLGFGEAWIIARADAVNREPEQPAAASVRGNDLVDLGQGAQPK
jgi:cell division septation protein DedD